MDMQKTIVFNMAGIFKHVTTPTFQNLSQNIYNLLVTFQFPCDLSSLNYCS